MIRVLDYQRVLVQLMSCMELKQSKVSQAVFTSETLKSDICFQSVPLECTTWSAQLDRLWSAEQEATGLNPSRTNTQGLKMMEQEVLHL